MSVQYSTQTRVSTNIYSLPLKLVTARILQFAGEILRLYYDLFISFPCVLRGSTAVFDESIKVVDRVCIMLPNFAVKVEWRC